MCTVAVQLKFIPMPPLLLGRFWYNGVRASNGSLRVTEGEDSEIKEMKKITKAVLF